MARSVAIVFEPDFQERLEKVAFRFAVWIVDTPRNRAAADVVMRSAVDWPHISVTLFRAPEDALSRDDWRGLVRQIGSFDTAEIFGQQLTLPARAAFGECGMDRFDENEGGYRVSRTRR